MKNLKENIKQYRELKAEVADLQHRIKKINQGEITNDVVTASAGSPSYAKHSVKISGITEKTKKKIYTYKKLLSDSEEKITQTILDIEMQIQNIDDSRIRQIIRYKYIDGLNFIQIASRIGGGNTADGVRKAINRYLNNI